jgi:hypothetical protein
MEVANTMDYGIPSIRLVAGHSTEASISADLGLPNLKPIKYRRSAIGNTTRVGLNIALRGRPVPSDAGRDAFTPGATGSPAPLPKASFGEREGTHIWSTASVNRRRRPGPRLFDRYRRERHLWMAICAVKDFQEPADLYHVHGEWATRRSSVSFC